MFVKAVKMQPWLLESSMDCSVGVPAPLLTPAPCSCAPLKVAGDAPSCWVTASQVGFQAPSFAVGQFWQL